ncbi:Uncharacterised protein [uncultured archaeon]|nr:Uncharacterised protein [uncultured archaeon]
MSSIKLKLTPEEEKQLEAFVREHPDIIQKLRKPLEAQPHECGEKGSHHGQGLKLVAPRESDIATLSALASRVSMGEKIADVDWQEVAFVGACVFVG